MNRLPGFLCATTLCIAAILLLTTSIAAASDGLAITSEKVYTPQPDSGAVDVAATFVLTNVKPTEYFDTYSRSYWFESFSFAVLAEATDVAVTTAGRSLSVTREPLGGETTFEILNIRLPRHLNYQQTITLEVSWTLPSGAVRDDAIVRVSPSYITFPIIACCDPGAANVRVEIPAGFQVELLGEQGDQLALMNDGDGQWLEALAIEDPGEFVATMFARNDDGLVVELVRFGPGNAEVRSWPDDPAWADFVAATIEEDLPILEQLIGEPWPLDETLVVVETVSPYLEGYGGTYSNGVIEIGENLDEKIVLHELSHAWLNGELSEERWIIEGLAEEFSSRTLAATSAAADQASVPEAWLDPTRPDQNSVVASPLQDWPYAAQLRGREDQPDFEKYHYNASWWVMRQISEEIGVEKLAEVVEALLHRQTPFVGKSPDEVMLGPITTQRFLDTAERRGGSIEAQQLMIDHVFNRSSSSQLPARAAAHERYERLLERGGDWPAPLGVRQRLTDWDFETAAGLAALAMNSLDDRDRTAALASELGVAPSAESEDRFSAARFASDFADLEAFAAKEFDALTKISERRIQVDTTARDLGTTVPAWLQSASADAARSQIDERLSTLAVLADATEIVASDRGFVTWVGLLGTDPGRHLQEAQVAFAHDDRMTTIDRAQSATQSITDAARIGRFRILRAAIASAVAVLLLVFLANLARRTSRPPDH